MLLLKIPNLYSRLAASVLALCWLAAGTPLHAGNSNVVVSLRNGDRLTGQLLAQETNQVVLATPWAGTLTIPISAIGGLRVEGKEVVITPAAPAPSASAPASKPAVAIAATAPPQPKATPTAPAPPKGKFQVNLDFGTDLLFGALDRQLYWGRLRTSYERPYASNPKHFFRTLTDYNVDYGETEGVRSANRMSGSLKTDFDFASHGFLYNAVNGGYDEIRKIEVQYGAGPGLGYHLFTKPAFAMNVESGFNYQAQLRSAGANVDSTYLRVAEDFKWKLAERLTLSKKFEFYMNLEDPNQYRFKLDSTLSYRLLSNLSLNVSVLDLYDTDPAPNVDRNEFQVRSSVGFTF